MESREQDSTNGEGGGFLLSASGFKNHEPPTHHNSGRDLRVYGDAGDEEQIRR